MISILISHIYRVSHTSSVCSWLGVVRGWTSDCKSVKSIILRCRIFATYTVFSFSGYLFSQAFCALSKKTGNENTNVTQCHWYSTNSIPRNQSSPYPQNLSVALKNNGSIHIFTAYQYNGDCEVIVSLYRNLSVTEKLRSRATDRSINQPCFAILQVSVIDKSLKFSWMESHYQLWFPVTLTACFCFYKSCVQQLITSGIWSNGKSWRCDHVLCRWRMNPWSDSYCLSYQKIIPSNRKFPFKVVPIFRKAYTHTG